MSVTNFKQICVDSNFNQGWKEIKFFTCSRCVCMVAWLLQEEYIYIYTVKGKAIPVTGHEGP
jgi:hypothetical protein